MADSTPWKERVRHGEKEGAAGSAEREREREAGEEGEEAEYQKQ